MSDGQGRYRRTLRLVPEASRARARAAATQDPDGFPEFLARYPAEFPSSLAELARLEGRAAALPELPARPVEQLSANPTLELLTFSWQGLCRLFLEGRGDVTQGAETVLLYRHPETGSVEARVASAQELLALKVVVEGIDPVDAARQGEVPVGVVDAALEQAVTAGILLAPPSRIRRDDSMFPVAVVPESLVAAQVFTLQWHITQACDLHCKHCYDRSKRQAVTLEEGVAILDDFRRFCRERQVAGQVSFSGGNPLLHPQFYDLYRAAVERNLGVAILGNPVPREWLERICAIRPPVFYQVSLEGLEPHTDYIRGKGHFSRVLDFLEELKAVGVYSMVMLTLTRDNVQEVLQLADQLKGRVDLFTFNRLAMVGEGASLASVEPEKLPSFLESYMDAAERLGFLSLKDNLFNILRHREGTPLLGGCTGFGCGAAFNFVSLLPDGEVHACRKFPSPIGSIREQSLAALYDSEEAARYRRGSRACRECPVRPGCGGCLAVAHGFGLDVFEERDPYCFFDALDGKE